MFMQGLVCQDGLSGEVGWVGIGPHGSPLSHLDSVVLRGCVPVAGIGYPDWLRTWRSPISRLIRRQYDLFFFFFFFFFLPVLS